MASCKITLIGFHEYMKANNDDLFANLMLPEGIDRDTVISNIILKGGEFEVLYSNPLFVKSAIETWSKKWSWTFERWIRAISEEYNPLHNYDRTEEYTDLTSAKINNKSSAKTESSSEDSSEGSSTSNSEDTKSAYDSDTYEPLNKNESGSESSNSSSSSSDIESSAESNNEENRTFIHSARMYGNIGIVSSQQMLESEIQIAYFNLYDRIADVFLQEFVLPVY